MKPCSTVELLVVRVKLGPLPGSSDQRGSADRDDGAHLLHSGAVLAGRRNGGGRRDGLDVEDRRDRDGVPVMATDWLAIRSTSSEVEVLLTTTDGEKVKV